ncbi:MAG: TRAP transporter small permease [Desulfuromonadales bacterium]|nr:TRAP transporter small permease [Desulfuromonadales bacterium]
MDKDKSTSGKSSLAKINHAIGEVINWFEVGSLIVCVTALSTLLIVNFIARNFFTSIYFAEEISEFLVIFTTFVGLSYGVRKGRHVRMGAFLEMMSPAVEKVFIIIISLISCGVMFYMTNASYEYLMNSINRGHLTPALRLPFWLYYVIIPVGFFMAGVQFLRTIVKNLTEKDTWMSPEQQSEYEDEEIFTGE